MTVVLPRSCLGKEIIRAARSLTQVSSRGKRKFVVAQSPKRFVQDMGPAWRKTGQSRFQSVDLSLRAYVLKKRFVFWGAESWEPENSLVIKISDLELETAYQELALEITFVNKQGAVMRFDAAKAPRKIEQQVNTAIREILTALMKTA